ncbi:hypothetical protein BD779DRAFT_438021 [Infundibulicybe gibba]|nr:hypothetical protein BD779DRAFT_438021 [Infundibulicybe gibba]
MWGLGRKKRPRSGLIDFRWLFVKPHQKVAYNQEQAAVAHASALTNLQTQPHHAPVIDSGPFTKSATSISTGVARTSRIHFIRRSPRTPVQDQYTHRAPGPSPISPTLPMQCGFANPTSTEPRYVCVFFELDFFCIASKLQLNRLPTARQCYIMHSMTSTSGGMCARQSILAGVRTQSRRPVIQFFGGRNSHRCHPQCHRRRSNILVHIVESRFQYLKFR